VAGWPAALVDLSSLEIQNLVAASVDDHGSLLSVERDSKLRALEAARMPASPLPDQAFAGKVERHRMRVGGFLIIVVPILAAAGRHAGRVINPQPPAADVQRVDAVVAQFARAPVPEQMPVVVNVVVVERPLRRRSLPQFPIQPIRRWSRLA